MEMLGDSQPSKQQVVIDTAHVTDTAPVIDTAHVILTQSEKPCHHLRQ